MAMKRRDYSNGGSVRGPGGPRADAVKAWLSNNEYVLPADTVQQVGLPALDQLRMATHRFANGGQVKRYADGGSVVYGMPWQPPTEISPSAQQRGNALVDLTRQRVDLKGAAPAQFPARPPDIGGASNMAAVPRLPAAPPVQPSPVAQTYAPTSNPGDVAAALPATSPKAQLPAANYPGTDSISNLGDYSGAQELAARSGAAIGVGRASDYANQTGGQRLINYAPGAGGNQSVVAGNSRQIGVQGRSGALPTPTYQTDYTIFGQNGPQGTASITGPNQRRGGGTLSVMDQGNGGTVDGNVAALNRQIEAIRSLREAQNPGITTGTGAFAPHQGLPDMDPFTRPTDSAGDGPARQQEYESLMRRAATDPGLTAKQRAMMVESAQGLIAPGLAQMKQQGELYGQRMDANQRQQAAQWAAQQQAAQLGLDQQKQGFEQQKWGQQYGLNQLNALTGAQQRGAQTQEAQLRARALANTDQLLRAYQQLSMQNPKDPRLNQLREWIMLSQRRNEPADPNAWMQQLPSDTATTQ